MVFSAPTFLSNRGPWLGLTGAFLLTLTPWAADLKVSAHTLGAIAGEDVVTPVELKVIDRERTQALRSLEAQRIQPFYRFIRTAAPRAVEDMKLALAKRRAEFIEELQVHYGHPVPLRTSELAEARFSTFVRNYNRARPDFQINPSLAELWALADSGDAFTETLLDELRHGTGGYVTEDGARDSGTQSRAVRIVSATSLNESLGLAAAEQESVSLPTASLPTLEQARADLVRNSRLEDKAMASFVAGFLRPNCFPDADLTREAQANRTNAINVVEVYPAGSYILRKGERVSARALLGLGELQSHLAAGRQGELTAASARSPSDARPASLPRAATDGSKRRDGRFVGWGLAGGVLLLAIGAWVYAARVRRTRKTSRGTSALELVRGTAELPLEAEAWRTRALEAEARAEKATALMKARLMPHLARWMIGELTQRLLFQRTQILTLQQRAEKEVLDLAERLEHIHAPLEDRLRAYECRIADLEAQLAAKGQENLELIKARIETTRKQMEGERGQETLNWN